MTTTPEDTRPLVSLIVPALNEAAGVPHLLERYDQLRAEHAEYAFEMLVIDDGSTDDTATALATHPQSDSSVTIVSLARNFGSHYAISAGLARCRGDVAMVLGADLPEPSSLAGQFLQQWEAGADVAWGIRVSRTARNRLYTVASRGFSWLFSRYARLSNYPPEGPSGVLVDRVVIDQVNNLSERNRNVYALIAWLGFTQTTVTYEPQERRFGASRWTRKAMLGLAVDSLLQFSSLPLRLCTFTGVAVGSLGMLYAIVLVTRALLGVQTPSGWATVIVVVLLLGGVQLAVIGISGEYLWRAVEETRNRPLYVVRQIRYGDGRWDPATPRRGARTSERTTHLQLSDKEPHALT